MEFFAIALIAAGTLLFYGHLRAMVKEPMQRELVSIANSAAAVIDADKLNSIQSESDTRGKNFLEIRNSLKKIAAKNPGVDDIVITKNRDRLHMAVRAR